MDLSIIVLNYNGKNLLENLLPSLKRNCLDKTRFQFEIIVVDNASTDDSMKYLSSIDFIRVISSSVNGGFAYGNNLALKSNASRYIMLLNNDTELASDCSDLDILIQYMDNHPEVGVLTPKVVLSNGAMDMACHRGEPTPWASFCYFSKIERITGKSRIFGKYHLNHLDENTIHDIEACSGAAMMVRKKAIEEIGLLDEQFFMYAEDLDWCKRFREAGWKIRFQPEVKVLHHKYKSGIGNEDGTVRINTIQWFYRSMLLYYDKHYKKRYGVFLRVILAKFANRKINKLGRSEHALK
jgi:GT2 family glycosyltransferase